MYKLTDISLKFSDTQLFNNLSLSLFPGEFTVLLGPNGTGKSTLLNIAAGSLTPDSGIVTLDSQPIGSFSPKELAIKRAVMSQNLNLGFAFEVFEVVMMGRSPHTTSNKENEEIATQMLDLMDSTQYADRLYPTLSGGQQQRVQAARVLSQLCKTTQEAYLFLDEPTSSLDPFHQHQLLQNSKKFASDHNIGVVAVLHDLNLAAQYADRIIILNDGKIHSDGKPSEVLTQASINEVYHINTHIVSHLDQRFPLIVTLPQERSA